MHYTEAKKKKILCIHDTLNSQAVPLRVTMSAIREFLQKGIYLTEFRKGFWFVDKYSHFAFSRNFSTSFSLRKGLRPRLLRLADLFRGDH